MLANNSPSRRQFLQTAALAALASSASAAAPVRRIGLGFSLYGMKTLPLDRALSECARIGYRNVELSLIAGFPTEPAKLTPAGRATIRQQLTAAGLPVASLLVNLSLTAEEKAEQFTMMICVSRAKGDRIGLDL